MGSLHQDDANRTSEDDEIERAARDAVLEVPLFPELRVELIRALGYGPHVDMLQHFCYWFHPRKPKMQNRWTLYKTYAEWRDECGLSERQVNKGRKKLGELGLVSEKKGPHGRLHYRVDWIALAEILSFDTVGVETDDNDIPFDYLEDDASFDTVGVETQFRHQGEDASFDTVGVGPNTEDYAGDYFQKSSVLQTAAEPAVAEPAERGIKEKTKNRRSQAPPVATSVIRGTDQPPAKVGQRGKRLARL